MRHLSSEQAKAALRRGKSVEQYLGRTRGPDGSVVRWLTLYMSAGSFRLLLHAAHEPTVVETFDIATYASVNEDEESGEGRLLIEARTWESVTSVFESVGATPERWVNEGLVGSEFADDMSIG